MFDLFLFVGLPYVALVSLIVGSIVRYRTRAFSYSSLSTQFLEDRWLVWASLPWHVGIIVVLLGHVLAFCLPGIWTALMSVPVLLFLAETIGLLSATLCLISLIILLARRFVNARLQAVTSYMDVVVLLLLFVSGGDRAGCGHASSMGRGLGAGGPWALSRRSFCVEAGSKSRDGPAAFRQDAHRLGLVDPDAVSVHAVGARDLVANRVFFTFSAKGRLE